MNLSFHRQRQPYLEVLSNPAPPGYAPPVLKTRKPNKRGVALRRRIVDFVRAHGEVHLSVLCKEFGGASTVVGTLLTMAENGLLVVLDHDLFAVPEGGGR